MAEFLTTNGISFHIENIISNSKNELVLVSPYLQLSKTLFERLKDAAKRNVKIIIIYGKDELKPNSKNSLAELKNIHLFYFENLHAKCYYNELNMVITSMNMYEYSEKTNREMGVLINSTTDHELYIKAIEETNSIINSADPIQLSKNQKNKINYFNSRNQINNLSIQKPSRGYCIRCSARIEYNVEKPYCIDCYFVWAQFENYNYPENVCHRCGEFEQTSMNGPQDRDCYKLWKNEN